MEWSGSVQIHQGNEWWGVALTEFDQAHKHCCGHEAHRATPAQSADGIIGQAAELITQHRTGVGHHH